MLTGGLVIIIIGGLVFIITGGLVFIITGGLVFVITGRLVFIIISGLEFRLFLELSLEEHLASGCTEPHVKLPSHSVLEWPFFDQSIYRWCVWPRVKRVRVRVCASTAGLFFLLMASALSQLAVQPGIPPQAEL